MDRNTACIDCSHTGRCKHYAAFGRILYNVFKESGFTGPGPTGQKDGYSRLRNVIFSQFKQVIFVHWFSFLVYFIIRICKNR